VAVGGREVARRAVAFGVVGIALRRARVAAAGQLQRVVIGEVARAAGVGDRQYLAVGIEAYVLENSISINRTNLFA